MARGIQYQGDFSGGRVSPEAAGKINHPWFLTFMAESYNGLPVEGGQWTRRAGTHWLAPTYLRATDAAVRAILLDSGHRHCGAITTDATDGYLHLFRGAAVVTNSNNTVDASSSAAGVLSITSHTATGWSVGDQVIFSTIITNAGLGYLNRWCKITAIAGAAITLKDDNGVAFGFDSAANGLLGATISRIQRFKLPALAKSTAAASIVNLGAFAGNNIAQVIIAHLLLAPQLLTLTTPGVGAVPDVFTLGAMTFNDGPYLDPQGTIALPETGTVNAYSGAITFTPATYSFVAGDVGRLIRLFSEPAAWVAATNYALNATVKYNSAYWVNVYGAGATGTVPGSLYTTGGVQYTVWAPAPTAGQWAWGTITAQAGASASVTLSTPLNSVNGTTVSIWRLGAYKTGQYPNCGILYEGRLYLAGAYEGRFDASMSGDPFTWSPTDAYGNVFDSHGLNLKLAAFTIDQVQWFRPDRAGLLFGTAAEEYVLSGGSPDVAITPTNFQIKRVSGYGTALGVRAVSCAFSHVFVGQYGSSIYEFVTDVFAASPSGRRLNPLQQNMTDTYGAIRDLAYTECRVPAVWGMTANGSLMSCTYRRFSRFMSSPPDMAGWAVHQIADGARQIQSVASIEAIRDGENADYLYFTEIDNGAGPPSGVELMKLNMEGA